MGNFSPLAERLRPKTLSDFYGQDHLVGVGGPLRTAIENDNLFSFILWGPPGTGKTTLANIIATATNSHFFKFSAVTSGVSDIRKAVETARDRLKAYGQRTILFIDEIHRFNKAQQDVLLPHIENGILILIGATTENPSFEVIGPLLSRCRVYVLTRLTEDNLGKLLEKVLANDGAGFKDRKILFENQAKETLLNLANGDARSFLNALEVIVTSTKANEQNEVIISKESIAKILSQKSLLYDRVGEEHFNLISAVHKSLRGSDPNAAIYYILRMLEAGEDPLYIARRLVRFASEDIGNADPNALTLAVSAFKACDFMGMPECRIILVQLAAYLARAPKDNSCYVAEGAALSDIKKYGNLPVPLKLRNAPTSLMRELGFGKEYKYVHDFLKDELKSETYLPDELLGRNYFNKL